MNCKNCGKEISLLGSWSGFVEWNTPNGHFKKEPICSKCSLKIEKAIIKQHRKQKKGAKE